MTATERPQIYLVTPPVVELASFPDLLASAMDQVEIACLRLALSGSDTDALGRIADACREVAHARDVMVVIDRHLLLAQQHGLDGVHLTDGARSVRYARKELGADAIVGAFCGDSRHEGMGAGESGADYVSFGPISGSLGDGSLAEHDLFEWWSATIEVPVVAEGGLTPEVLQRFAPVTDFFALGDEIWGAADPVAELKRLAAIIRG